MSKQLTYPSWQNTFSSSVHECKHGSVEARLKVIFSDKSGQNLNLVKPTQYDGSSQDSILDFQKCSLILSIC